jgi:hypothetical protein
MFFLYVVALPLFLILMFFAAVNICSWVSGTATARGATYSILALHLATPAVDGGFSPFCEAPGIAIGVPVDSEAYAVALETAAPANVATETPLDTAMGAALTLAVNSTDATDATAGLLLAATPGQCAELVFSFSPDATIPMPAAASQADVLAALGTISHCLDTSFVASSATSEFTFGPGIFGAPGVTTVSGSVAAFADVIAAGDGAFHGASCVETAYLAGAIDAAAISVPTLAIAGVARIVDSLTVQLGPGAEDDVAAEQLVVTTSGAGGFSAVAFQHSGHLAIAGLDRTAGPAGTDPAVVLGTLDLGGASLGLCTSVDDAEFASWLTLHPDSTKFAAPLLSVTEFVSGSTGDLVLEAAVAIEINAAITSFTSSGVTTLSSAAAEQDGALTITAPSDLSFLAPTGSVSVSAATVLTLPPLVAAGMVLGSGPVDAISSGSLFFSAPDASSGFGLEAAGSAHSVHLVPADAEHSVFFLSLDRLAVGSTPAGTFSAVMTDPDALFVGSSLSSNGPALLLAGSDAHLCSPGGYPLLVSASTGVASSVTLSATGASGAFAVSGPLVVSDGSTGKLILSADAPQVRSQSLVMRGTAGAVLKADLINLAAGADVLLSAGEDLTLSLDSAFSATFSTLSTPSLSFASPILTISLPFDSAISAADDFAYYSDYGMYFGPFGLYSSASAAQYAYSLEAVAETLAVSAGTASAQLDFDGSGSSVVRIDGAFRVVSRAAGDAFASAVGGDFFLGRTSASSGDPRAFLREQLVGDDGASSGRLYVEAASASAPYASVTAIAGEVHLDRASTQTVTLSGSRFVALSADDVAINAVFSFPGLRTSDDPTPAALGLIASAAVTLQIDSGDGPAMVFDGDGISFSADDAAVGLFASSLALPSSITMAEGCSSDEVAFYIPGGGVLFSVGELLADGETVSANLPGIALSGTDATVFIAASDDAVAVVALNALAQTLVVGTGSAHHQTLTVGPDDAVFAVDRALLSGNSADAEAALPRLLLDAGVVTVDSAVVSVLAPVVSVGAVGGDTFFILQEADVTLAVGDVDVDGMAADIFIDVSTANISIAAAMVNFLPSLGDSADDFTFTLTGGAMSFYNNRVVYDPLAADPSHGPVTLGGGADPGEVNFWANGAIAGETGYRRLTSYGDISFLAGDADLQLTAGVASGSVINVSVLNTILPVAAYKTVQIDGNRLAQPSGGDALTVVNYLELLSASASSALSCADWYCSAALRPHDDAEPLHVRANLAVRPADDTESGPVTIAFDDASGNATLELYGNTSADPDVAVVAEISSATADAGSHVKLTLAAATTGHSAVFAYFEPGATVEGTATSAVFRAGCLENHLYSSADDTDGACRFVFPDALKLAEDSYLQAATDRKQRISIIPDGNAADEFPGVHFSSSPSSTTSFGAAGVDFGMRYFYDDNDSPATLTAGLTGRAIRFPGVYGTVVLPLSGDPESTVYVDDVHHLLFKWTAVATANPAFDSDLYRVDVPSDYASRATGSVVFGPTDNTASSLVGNSSVLLQASELFSSRVFLFADAANMAPPTTLAFLDPLRHFSPDIDGDDDASNDPTGLHIEALHFEDSTVSVHDADADTYSQITVAHPTRVGMLQVGTEWDEQSPRLGSSVTGAMMAQAHWCMGTWCRAGTDNYEECGAIMTRSDGSLLVTLALSAKWWTVNNSVLPTSTTLLLNTSLVAIKTNTAKDYNFYAYLDVMSEDGTWSTSNGPYLIASFTANANIDYFSNVTSISFTNSLSSRDLYGNYVFPIDGRATPYSRVSYFRLRVTVSVASGSWLSSEYAGVHRIHAAVMMGSSSTSTMTPTNNDYNLARGDAKAVYDADLGNNTFPEYVAFPLYPFERA